MIHLTFHSDHGFIWYGCRGLLCRNLWKLLSCFELSWHHSPSNDLFIILGCFLIWPQLHIHRHFHLRSFWSEESRESEGALSDPFLPVFSTQYRPNFQFRLLLVFPKQLPLWTHFSNQIEDDAGTQLDSWAQHYWDQDAFWRGIFWDIEGFRGIVNFLQCSHMGQTSNFFEYIHGPLESRFHLPWKYTWFWLFHW